MQRIAEGIRQHCADSLAPYADAIAEVTPEDVEAMQDDVIALNDLEQTAEERDEPFLVEGQQSVLTLTKPGFRRRW